MTNMTRRADTPLTRADFHAARGVLLVTREPPPTPPPAKGQPALVGANPQEGVEILLAVWDDGSVTALHGHVDLGTGLRTALAQIVVEELDVPMGQINMVLGDTARAPNQGATIASASIQIHAAPLRAAAAQARAWLQAHTGSNVNFSLLEGQHIKLPLNLHTPVKDPKDHHTVGTRVPRLDIPAKVTGELTFVHDMRVPGMLHGRVVRPPYAGADHGDFIGNTLQSVHEASIAHIPGIKKVVVIRDFVGVVALREEHAEQAMRELRVTWKPWPGLHNLSDLEGAIRANPSKARQLIDNGDVDAAIAGADLQLARNYVWPYQMHASIGPSCAVADWTSHAMTVWAGTQNPHVLRADLSRLMGLPDVAINVIRMETAGCYGRNGADDVAADAALLSRAVGAPVRVQLSREQEHAWEPKGAAQLMQVNGGLNADGTVAAYDFQTAYPSNGSPTLALLLTRSIEPLAQAYEMGDRTARPPYDWQNLRVTVNDMPPMLRASWLRGVSALPNSFAHESYIDELATAAGVDPVAFRLQYLNDPRAAELLQATAQRAAWQPHTQPQQHSWQPHTQPQQQAGEGDLLHGQGVAYARYIHSKWPGYGAAWAAWVADVQVNKVTGEVHVKKVVVGHDAGSLINPAGVEHQIHGNVLQTTSRALLEQVATNPQDGTVAALEWGSYPILSFRDVPVIEVVSMPRPGEPPLGAGESSSVPGTAAIANAIFDATGVRFRQPPFTPEVVRAALNPLPAPSNAPVQGHATPPALPTPIPEITQFPKTALWPKPLSWWARTGALLAGTLGVVAGLAGWRSAIPPVTQPTLAGGAPIYTAALIERGQQVAAMGNCAGCHTAEGGARNAGGRSIDTPFGSIISTNLTPDAQTGIGAWSLPAFQRAMRQGISRDGHHLYPAFPYTAYAQTTDEDLTALYAYLMAQSAVRHQPPATQLAFPYNLRPLMAGWNALFLDNSVPKQPTALVDTAQAAIKSGVIDSVAYQRGDYLVNSLGHCSACHTPRNAFGAEQTGKAYLSGALVDGWEAPALTGLSRAPVPWSQAEFYRYLRQGHTEQHGAANGPMAQIVRELAVVPDEDIRAMSVYLASFTEPISETQSAALATQQVKTAQANASALLGPAQRLFNGACASCHHDGDGPTLLGINIPLALNTKLHSDRPDNLIRTILDGVREPAAKDIGFMPAFRHSLSDEQIGELAGYMRQRFAPGKAAWDLTGVVGRVRGAGDGY